MNATRLAALAAASLSLAAAAPLCAQDFPVAFGEYVDMTSVTIDDGHTGDYAKFLAGEWKAQQEFAKSQGWITGYEILGNVNKRPGEPDLYLVTRYKSVPDAAEMDRRDKAFKARMRMTDTQLDAGSADRAKFRHVIGSQMLQVITTK